MKSHRLFRSAMLPLVVTSFFLSFTAQSQADEEKDTPLAKAMKESSTALKKLRKIAKDDWKGGADAARAAAEGCRKGMAYIPAMVKEMPDGDAKTKAIADYRRLMGLSYAALSELELAYLEKSPEKIAAAMKKIKAGKKEGHKKYEDE